MGTGTAFRDIASLSAKLFAGEIFIKSDLFDSVRFKGVSMFTDESMMPPDLSEGMPLKLPGLPPQTQRSPYHKMAVSSAK
ncbi:fimbria/pilus outer membrane usher protein [Providencia hangzhouensis]|uniref:fimbria/pilus outer membrane usher protein n=1 Tax=Providencia hangzhouensis TaxID=3031799 RepID=UPI0034DD493C